MSDYIPPPVIENALIILADLPVEPGAVESSEALRFLKTLAGYNGATTYVFISPPEAMDTLDDLWPEAMDHFALAAQVEETRVQAWHGAVRRVFSRATVKRAVVVEHPTPSLSLDDLNACFLALRDSDILLRTSGDVLVAGFTSYDPDFFSSDATTSEDLMKTISTRALAKSHKIA